MTEYSDLKHDPDALQYLKDRKAMARALSQHGYVVGMWYYHKKLELISQREEMYAFAFQVGHRSQGHTKSSKSNVRQ
ncbi:hypothetical protein D9615_009671 [Tricholomella constricta]|uniref:Uncharacterized protein n=1 Tax=Tricholomella constricta TaxID=117010 RepID=A0A8H5LVX7_9AGAR|nr:hypothetical protein D9615_009671 [Tricholomella constricta]